VEERWKKKGYRCRVVHGYHNGRDEAMTGKRLRFLWVREEAETAKLYGGKYRPGRVSGTQNNAGRGVVKIGG
jgi:hypothetical protein